MTDNGNPTDATGNRRVDDAVALLNDLSGKPTSSHVDVFEEIHRRLQAVLADVDGS